MPRNRTARLAVLGSFQRPAGSRYPSRSATALKRRIVVGLLVLLSLTMITISFREEQGGPLHDLQSAGATALRPLQVGAERVVRPFRDAYGWFADLFAAKGEAERLRVENERLRQEAVQFRNAYAENRTLREFLDYKAPPTYPGDFDPVFAAVIGHPSTLFVQQVVIAAGKDDGVRVDDPVVNADGLVGRVTAVTPDTAQVTLLTDESTSVSARDLQTEATGLVENGRAGSTSLVLSRVEKRYEVHQGDEIVTAGSQRGQLPSLFPRGISVGRVTFVGRTDTDLYLRIQIRPSVDFGSLDALKLGAVVLVAAVLQVTVFGAFEIRGGSPDLLLVVVVAIALLRGALTGATVGFLGGLLADTATLQMLGVTSLLLTVAGYWAGRYGETTGRDRSHAPLLAVGVVTVLYAVCALVLHFVLGHEVGIGRALGGSLLWAVVANVLLTIPVYALCRRVLGPPPSAERAREVQLLA